MTLPRDDRDAEITHLRATVAELLAVVADLRRQVESQRAHIHRLVKITFGPRGERVEGPTLFDTVLPPEPDPVPLAAPASDRPVSAARRGHGRRSKPAELPRERVELDLTDAEKRCPCCAAVRVRVGQEISERLDYRPASLFVREVARPTYVCRVCEQAGHDPQFTRAARPAEVVPRGGVGPGLLAHVAVAKFIDHLPLHRQASILEREGWTIPRSTLCDHLRACGQVLAPLVGLMANRVRASHAIHADETPVTVLRPKRSAYAWVYLGDAEHPYTVFDLTPGRSKEYPEAFLAGYTGFVHADAYAGYNRVHGGVRHVGCWMHARRAFVEARASDPAKASEALAFIRTLYAVERAIAEPGLTGDRVVSQRRTRAGPVLDRFATWLETEARTARPKSPLGSAVLYARNGWQSLTRYLTDARLAIDNGAAERAIRPLAVSRRNWLFIGGDGGLATASALLSVCASARRHELNAWSYLRDLFERLPAVPVGSDLTEFLPDVWAKTHRRH